MKQIINLLDSRNAKANLFRFRIDGEKKIAILGVYDGTTFEGSDRLSMGIMKDAYKFRKLQLQNEWSIICEGDRFTNSTFVTIFDPIIIKITNSGEAGRKLRNSHQSERHIKAIETRVSNINANYNVKNSSEALLLIKKMIKL